MKSLGATILVAWLLGGCGPITSGVGILKANVEISAAKTAGAESLSPFEYVSAVEYLQKSREEHGYSDFAASRRYADKALEFALQARRRAESQSQADQPAMLPAE